MKYRGWVATCKEHYDKFWSTVHKLQMKLKHLDDELDFLTLNEVMLEGLPK